MITLKEAYDKIKNLYPENYQITEVYESDDYYAFTVLAENGDTLDDDGAAIIQNVALDLTI